MSRIHRISSTILHVIVRGNGKQILFEDYSDYMHFLELLKKYRDETNVILLAYCLMDNHAHLLVMDLEHQISVFMKRLGISYAMYFNRRYDHVGHVFQGRFLSENITSDLYLRTVFRYILKNPEKAGIAKASDYRWNSYHEYGKSGCLCDSSCLLYLIGDLDSLDALLDEADETEVMEYYRTKHDDEWALKIICSSLQIQSGTELQHFPKAERNDALAFLKGQGLTVRQLERLTGISKGVIQRAKWVTENRPQ